MMCRRHRSKLLVFTFLSATVAANARDVSSTLVKFEACVHQKNDPVLPWVEQGICDSRSDPFAEIKIQSKEIKGVLTDNRGFIRALYLEAMGHTLLNYAIQLGNEGKALSPSQIVSEVCHQGAVPSQNCDPKDEKDFQDFLRSNLKTLATRFPPFHGGDLVECKRLNSEIDHLNLLLAKVKPGEKWSKQSALALQAYQLEFSRMASEIPGAYIFTSKLIKQVGNIKTPQDIQEASEIDTTAQHSELDCGSRGTAITDARDEVKDKLIEKIKELNMDRSAFQNLTPSGVNKSNEEMNQREQDTRSTMIRENPIALGHLLADHPEYLTFDDSVCHTLSRMGADDVNSKLVVEGSELVILAGVAVIAAPSGAAVLGKAMQAGLTLHSILAEGSVVATAVGVARQTLSSVQRLRSPDSGGSVDLLDLDLSAWSDNDLLAHEASAQSVRAPSATQRKLSDIQQATVIQEQNRKKREQQRKALDQRDNELMKELNIPTHSQ